MVREAPPESGVLNLDWDKTLASQHNDQGSSAGQARIAVLEDRIEKLETALLTLLKEKEEALIKVKAEAPAEEKPKAPELSDEEKCLPANWVKRFQWRRKNEAKDGDDYTEIDSPDGHAENSVKGLVSMVHDEDAKGSPERILIRNSKIQAHMRAIRGLETFGEVKLNMSSIEISSPFSPLFHHMDAIDLAMREDEQATSADLADIYALNQFCSKGSVGSMFQDIRKLIQQEHIRSEEQWALFRPGMFVVSKVLGEHEVLRVKSLRLEETRNYSFFADKMPDDYYLVCNQVAWNGKIFGQREREIRLMKFPGSKKIMDLNVCPLEKYPAAQRLEITEHCVARGKMWKELCKSEQAMPRDLDCRCLPLVTEDPGYWDPFAGEVKRSEVVETRIAGRVIVDPIASFKASKLGTMTETFSLNTSEIEPFAAGSEETIDLESQYMICAALIEIFALADHTWYRVPVGELKLPKWLVDPWDQLELSVDRKILLKTLVNAHTNLSVRSEDVIKTKGKGLVFLFHGQPGLGKTLTAEALSESIKRPLYRINIGLLAAKDDWEPDLEKIFQDAHAWQAVLLLDEAEVIMEARTKDRMVQNSWCSVFLRKLEYYEGILILTTNMIHSIDKAFRSRINIAIHYEELSLSQKSNLWTLFLGKIPSSRAKTRELMDNVATWADLPLNGRQIRNVVLTAEALSLGGPNAEYTKMDCSHVKIILKDTFAFNEAIDSEKKRRNLKVGSVPGNWL